MKVKELLLRAAYHGVAQVLGTILFLAGASFGLSLTITPDTYMTYPGLQTNFYWMSPVAWGAIFMAASILLVIQVWSDSEHAQLPALVLGILFIAFGIMSLFSGVTTIVYAFVALGWVSIFTQIVCWARGKREEILYRHEPD